MIKRDDLGGGLETSTVLEIRNELTAHVYSMTLELRNAFFEERVKAFEKENWSAY